MRGLNSQVGLIAKSTYLIHSSITLFKQYYCGNFSIAFWISQLSWPLPRTMPLSLLLWDCAHVSFLALCGSWQLTVHWVTFSFIYFYCCRELIIQSNIKAFSLFFLCCGFRIDCCWKHVRPQRCSCDSPGNPKPEYVLRETKSVCLCLFLACVLVWFHP